MKHCIDVRALSKSYRIGRSQHDLSLREQIVEFAKTPFSRGGEKEDEIWALRDMSFQASEGEVIGIIGRNGAGKSTLLKILSRITYPTSGEVKVRGRIASLLEVGTGFHDELTGRENVYLNGSILGMKKREVDRHFDAIVEFSGVEQFIDTPIKRYSSGMRLRLGFAVAAHLDPDVLVVDEVLAVGDAGFQKKCVETMNGLRSAGRTVLFVSHNLAAVENLCSRGIWIDAGRIRMDGKAQEVIEAYMGTFAALQGNTLELGDYESRVGTGDIRFTSLEYLSEQLTPREVVRSGDNLVLRFHYRVHKSVRNPSFGFRLVTEMGTLITETSTWHHRLYIDEVKVGEGYIDLQINGLNLIPGRYFLSLWVTDQGGSPVYDGDARAILDVEVADIYDCGRVPDSRWGLVFFQQRWRVLTT